MQFKTKKKEEVENESGRFSNLLANIVGVTENRFENYVMSGQCIIANFGFVQEQNSHTDYKPPTHYD